MKPLISFLLVIFLSVGLYAQDGEASRESYDNENMEQFYQQSFDKNKSRRNGNSGKETSMKQIGVDAPDYINPSEEEVADSEQNHQQPSTAQNQQTAQTEEAEQKSPEEEEEEVSQSIPPEERSYAFRNENGESDITESSQIGDVNILWLLENDGKESAPTLPQEEVNPAVLNQFNGQ